MTVDCPGDREGLAVWRGLAVAGRDGRTPSSAEGRALVITTRERRPTGDPARPEMVQHAYRLRVRAPGYATREIELAPQAPLPRPIEATLSQAH